MGVITQITDYESRLVSLLLGQFRTSSSWLKLWRALADTGKALQLSEDTVYLLWQQRTSLTSAVGRQLDQWGAVVGLPRAGWTDAAYRARILVWLQVLRSKGTPDELIRIMIDMTGLASTAILFRDTPPSSYVLQYTGAIYAGDPTLATDVAVYIRKADPTGVGPNTVIEAGTLLFADGVWEGVVHAGLDTFGTGEFGREL